MSMLIAEVTATCNALGYAVNGRNNYFLGRECKEAVRELIRFLKRDDENHEIRRYLGTARILQTDLVPILIQYYKDEEMFDLLLRLLVNLTIPALLLYDEELPRNKTPRQYYLQIIEHLQEYKEAFTEQRLWTVIFDKLSALLRMDWTERGEERSLIVVRILILIRNVLDVPANVDKVKKPYDDSIHDQAIWALYESGLMNLILYIATSENEKQYYFHILEIISLMLRGQDIEVLANTSVQRSVTEKEQEREQLNTALHEEMSERQTNARKHIASRHSRWGGTFVVRGIKSISENDLIIHSLNQEISFDCRKNKQKTPKNRLPMRSDVVQRRSSFSIRILLKEFCIEFLNGAYNQLMHYIKEMFHRGKAQNNDESYYFWAMQFFMEFNRYYKFEVKLISETMHVSIFHFTQERLEEWRSKLAIDKKKTALWSKRMHLGLKAYSELINTLFKMYQSHEYTVKETAHTIMSNIFYQVEYRELLMSLLSIFDEIKFSREYLKDLVESNHIFMKMLEHFCKRHRTLVVQKKAKKIRIRRQSSKKSKKKTVLTLDASNEKWGELKHRIMDIFMNQTELNIQSMPFDAASDIPFDEQKVEAVRRIRLYLVKSDVENAISLFRACREVWPENDCFGASYMLPEEECTALQEIFFTDIGFPAGANIQSAEDENEESSETSEDDERAASIKIGEQTFEFIEFVKKFVKPKIVYACCLLLSQFEKNNVYTNHCIVKLLHRITFDCKYAAILFQASVFRTFQRILDSEDERHTEMKQFAIFIVRKFADVVSRNKKVYMEILFWKTNKEAYEIEEGYGMITTKSTHRRRTSTSDEEMKIEDGELNKKEAERIEIENEKQEREFQSFELDHNDVIRREKIQAEQEVGKLENKEEKVVEEVLERKNFKEIDVMRREIRKLQEKTEEIEDKEESIRKSQDYEEKATEKNKNDREKDDENEDTEQKTDELARLDCKEDKPNEGDISSSSVMD